jgi:hypothetical protein
MPEFIRNHVLQYLLNSGMFGPPQKCPLFLHGKILRCMLTKCCTFAVFNMQITRAKPSMLNMVAGVLIPQLARHVFLLSCSTRHSFLALFLYKPTCQFKNYCTRVLFHNGVSLRCVHVAHIQVTQGARDFVSAIFMRPSPEHICYQALSECVGNSVDFPNCRDKYTCDPVLRAPWSCQKAPAPWHT